MLDVLFNHPVGNRFEYFGKKMTRLTKIIRIHYELEDGIEKSVQGSLIGNKAIPIFSYAQRPQNGSFLLSI